METVETITSSPNSTNAVLPAAYFFLKKYVLKYLKNNFEALSKKYDITKQDLSDLRKDKNAILEWVLGEHLGNNEFKDLGITVKSDWGIVDEEVHTTIYKIGRKYIRENVKQGYYMQKHDYDFVKPVKKKIIIETFDIVG